MVAACTKLAHVQTRQGLTEVRFPSPSKKQSPINIYCKRKISSLQHTNNR